MRGDVVLIEAASIAHENAPAGKRISNCTKFWQSPVDGLHSIENKRDRVAIFVLTSARRGVKTHSFFDKFPRFETAGKQATPTRKRGNTWQVRGLMWDHRSAPTVHRDTETATIDS